MIKDGHLTIFGKLLLSFTLGAGSAVAAAYTTFETAEAHRTDQVRNEDMLREIRGDVKTLLGRSGPIYHTPKIEPPRQGYGAPWPSERGK